MKHLDWLDSLLVLGAVLMIAGVSFKDWALAIILAGILLTAGVLLLARR